MILSSKLMQGSAWLQLMSRRHARCAQATCRRLVQLLALERAISLWAYECRIARVLLCYLPAQVASMPLTIRGASRWDTLQDNDKYRPPHHLSAVKQACMSTKDKRRDPPHLPHSMHAEGYEQEPSQDGQHPLVNVRRQLSTPNDRSSCAYSMTQNASKRHAHHIC